MDSICRLCTQKTPALSSVFSFKNERLISDMISIICLVKIDPTDIYPKYICRSCLRIIYEAYNLREKSVQSDIDFKSGKFKFKESEAQKQNKEPTRESIDAPKLPEIQNIKEERDPFNSAILFVDENLPTQNEENFEDSNENENSDYDENGEDDDDDDDDEDYYDEIIPFEPKNPKKRRYKYEIIQSDGNSKYKCPMCEKSFNHRSNVKRHILHDHENRKPKKVRTEKPKTREVVTSTTCSICGAYISHKQNLKRHINMHHPGHAIPKNEKHIQAITSNASELTRQFLRTPKKQKYIEVINVVSLENDNCYKYQCLLCLKEHNVSKVWSQNINNSNVSNIRRHLSTHHPDDFKRLEPNLSFVTYE